MRGVLGILGLTALLALVALPSALGRTAAGPPVFAATLKAASASTKVVTLTNRGTSTIVEFSVYPSKSFDITGSNNGRCAKHKDAGTGKTELSCKTSLGPGKRATVVLKTVKQGTGAAEAIVAVVDSNGFEAQKTVRETR